MAAYAKQTPSGTYEIFENDNRVATGSADILPNYGLSKTNFGTPPANAQAPAATVPAPTPPVTSAIPNPAPAPSGVIAPPIPQPQAPAIQTSYVNSLAQDVTRTRDAVESTYKNQIADTDKRIGESRQKIDALTEKEDILLDTSIDPLTQPFRETLENAERERLHINENFEANQSLVRELESLLTEGNEMISGERSRFASRSSIEQGVARTMEDVTGRTGVIQAVMAARSGQIAEAERMIDRSVEAINADRKDRLSYYQTVLSFYEGKKDEEGKRLLKLDDEKKAYVTAQIGLLENDMKQAQETAAAIKQAMLDPDLAQVYGQAGVTLNDTPEQIGQKLATYGYQKEVRDISNSMASDGYAFLAPGAKAPAGAHVVTITDSKGSERRYYGQPKVGTGTGGAGAPIVNGADGQPLEYGTPEYVTARLAATGSSKTKPVADERKQLRQFENVVALTDNLMGSLSKTKNDPLIGYLKGLNPYDFDARTVNAQITALVPSVARGVYGEVGVLTDSDIERYLQTLPNLKSTADQNKFVALMTLSNAMRAYEGTLLSLASSNVNVSGYADSYRNMAQTVAELEQDLGVGDAVIAGEDEAVFDDVLGGEVQEGNYFSRLWGALWGK